MVCAGLDSCNEQPCNTDEEGNSGRGQAWGKPGRGGEAKLAVMHINAVMDVIKERLLFFF